MHKQQDVFLTHEGIQCKFSSKFDNGNMEKVVMIAPKTFEIFTATDYMNSNPNPKNSFHFSVSGLPASQKIYFIVRRVNLLWPLYNMKIDTYRPVFKTENQGWEKLQKCEQVNLVVLNQLKHLHFSYTTDSNKQDVWFAFTFPYTYLQYQILINKATHFRKEGIFCQVETLIQSVEDRSTHLITISGEQKQLPQSESQFDEMLFPDKKPRPPMFRKPIILITARVHPGESPSSYVAEGIINYLLHDEGQHANLLRESFVFLIIPMLNPDGVYCGNYRSDPQGNNLNRFYKNLSKESHPTIYAVKSLVTYLAKRLVFYIDLHAHATQKSTFLYGNALEDFTSQVQNQLFTRLLSNNCLPFDARLCNFSKRQMSSKDTYEQMTKQGCGRVVVNNTTGVINCYTLECGYHYNQNNKNPFQQIENNPPLYKQIGEQILITILDLFQFNEKQNNVIDHNKLKFDMAVELSRVDRFRQFQSTKLLKTMNFQIDELIYKMLAQFIEPEKKSKTPLIKISLNTNGRYNNRSGTSKTNPQNSEKLIKYANSIETSVTDQEDFYLKRLIKTEFVQPRLIKAFALDQDFISNIQNTKITTPRMKPRGLNQNLYNNSNKVEKQKRMQQNTVHVQKNLSQLFVFTEACITEKEKYTVAGQDIYKKYLQTTAHYDRVKGMTAITSNQQKSRQPKKFLSEINGELYWDQYDDYLMNQQSSRYQLMKAKQISHFYSNRNPKKPQRYNISQGNVLPLIKETLDNSIKKAILIQAQQQRLLYQQYLKGSI